MCQGLALRIGRKLSDAAPTLTQLASTGADRQKETVRIRKMWARKGLGVASGVPAGPISLMHWWLRLLPDDVINCVGSQGSLHVRPEMLFTSEQRTFCSRPCRLGLAQLCY